MKNKKITKLLACATIALGMSTSTFTSFAQGPNSEDIDNGIANLKYNKNEVLAANGDTIENVVPKEGIKTNNKFIVVERKKKTLTTSPVDISIVDSVTDRTYPGALQTADDSFVENRPNILMCKRNQ